VKQKEVKEAHEKAIGRQLLKALKLKGKFLRHGEDDGEPDLIYSLDGKTVGIEIATAFYHNEQAEIESQLALGKLKSGRFGTPLGVPNDQDMVILSRARWELNDKCSKSYSGDEVWLCIDLQAPLLEISEAKQLADAITIPARHKFPDRNRSIYPRVPQARGGYAYVRIASGRKLGSGSRVEGLS